MNKAEKRGRYVKHPLRKVGREEWLELRREGIGGSDAAIIAGLNRFGSEMELWADKKGMAPEKEATEAMKIGVELEDYVARRTSRAGRCRPGTTPSVSTIWRYAGSIRCIWLYSSSERASFTTRSSGTRRRSPS